jgi:two-component system phosphate regulon sensor histidine kinase PhoR
MSNSPVKRGIFRRIFIIYALILILAALAIELSITDAVRESTINDLRHNLAIQARLISGSISFEPSSPLDGLCRQYKEQTGERVTVIAPGGKVLGDSETDSSGMENHGHRQEIQQAALNGTGMAIRFSDTLKYDFLYVAIRIDRGAHSGGFIRLSKPLKDVDAAINLLRIKILSVVLSILLAAGVVSLLHIDRIRRLTARIRDFSRSIAGGELGRTLHLERAGEFDEIADSLNTMSAELRQNIAAREEEQHRLNAVLRSVPDALFMIDANNTIRLASLAARKLFGETALRGRPFIEVVRSSEFLSLMEDVRCQMKPCAAEVKLDSPLEQYCVVQVSPLFYHERELSGFVAIFHDITRLKRLEQTRKDFVANISHELKTPIAAITGFAETLMEGALDDREHALKFLRTIRENSERINNLIDDLMTISKFELGAIKLEKSPVDVRDVAGQVLALLQDKAKQKGLSLELDIPQAFGPISADRDRLVQIFTNLADNAIKFTEKGGVKVGMAEENGGQYLFVADTGIGIAQKHLPRIGERFYRVDPGRSRSMGGTGLGLAIVKHLVKAHGWELRIDSTPGKGTKVRILI